MALQAAREIVREEGLAALTTRRATKAIGYTVGTLYQIFRDADDLIEQMNAETLDELHASCKQIDFDAGPAASLRALAERYLAYVSENPRLWAAVLEYRPANGHQRQELYLASVRRLMSLIEAAIDPFFEPNAERIRLHEARVLWASFYGISALSSERLLSKEESAAAMVETLIEIYVSSRGQTQKHRG
ncbi:MAG: TetR/AcrR family transcriptional regulator [Gemmatimonadales bacterium]